ncbi:hypothetical protein K440DRAFT_249380 [Wilcoxina mikolae CBS 423.85]|nr:hypothetical protein K440DRAFT_249380 [Wilcoxina mikolae CBS 423.85]
MVVQSHQLPSNTNPDDLVATKPTEDDARSNHDLKADVLVSNAPDLAPLAPNKLQRSETPSEEPNTVDSPSAQPNHDLLSPDIGDSISTPALQAKADAELAALTLNLAVAPLNSNGINEKRPSTPVKDTTTSSPAVSSPPPPSPPPKDVPPKDLPPKDIPSRSPIASPNGRLYLEHPPVTPVPSRPSSPLQSLTPNTRAASKSQPSSDDENDGTSSVIHDLFQKSHRASIVGEQLQRIPSTSSIGSPLMASPNLHPPRSSSLIGEPATEPTSSSQLIDVETHTSPQLTEKPLPTPILSTQPADNTPVMPVTPHRPPIPDEDLPFDFHRFLSQLRHRSADPVAKFLRSFLHEFAKKQWMVHEQVKIVRDFLTFIYAKMDLCEVWREVGDGEMDNAMEGMEKLVMNRLYTQTFSPAIPPHDGRSRVDERFPGRRGQHQEDVERDEVLTQKVRIYSWIREEHLDIGDTVSGDGGRRFLDLAMKEMLKIGSYRAPRDKVICVLNCCKVIFGLLRHCKSDESADKFVPLLIFVVLRANPEHLVSNVQYILRFRNPDKLSGEAGYYLSSLMGAIQFIENLDRSSLTITPEEFEANVEAAVAAIAERPPPPSPPSPPPKPRRSTDQPRIAVSSTESPEGGEEKAAVAGLLPFLQKPLSTIGRIFGDEGSSAAGPALTPQPGNTPRHSPHPADSDDPLLTAVGGRRHQPSIKKRPDGSSGATARLSAEEAAARQASAEAEEAARIGRMEYEHVVETLRRMFPDLDRDVICDVVNMKEGQ